MDKSTFTPLYEHFREKLVEMRRKAGMTQRDLAKALGREHSFVSRIEQGERRLDVVELFWVARACGEDPPRMASALMRQFEKLDGGEGRKARATRARG